MSSGTTSLPLHNMAEIPLPPGFTLEQFMALQGHLGLTSNRLRCHNLTQPTLVTIAITVAVAFAVVIWD